MILYDLNNSRDLMDFGIEIPVFKSRITKTLEYLKNHPVIGPVLDTLSIRSVKDLLTKEDLLRVHSADYVDRLYSERLEQELIRTYELVAADGSYHRYSPGNAKLPLSMLLADELRKASGTLQCCRVALEKESCFYFGGGFHHAKKDYGEGFCIINDIVIALRRLQADNVIGTAWVIDVDAHKGDGTAALTEGDSSIVTLSEHMADGWPLDGPMDIDGQPNPSFIPSDIDIPVALGEEAVYVSKLSEGLARLSCYPKPQLALVVSGSDPYEKDQLVSAQKLKLTLEQMSERDMLIYHFLKERHIPQAHLMSGGYGSECWHVDARFLECTLVNEV